MSFPNEIKEAVSALDNERRWRIVELVQDNEELAYTELLRILDVRKGSLTHHLNILMEGGILDNYSKGGFGGPYSSYYRLSRFGRDFLAGLLSSVEFTIYPRTYTVREPLHIKPSSPKDYASYDSILKSVTAFLRESHTKAIPLQVLFKKRSRYRSSLRTKEKTWLKISEP